jgi:hypothetical protein
VASVSQSIMGWALRPPFRLFGFLNFAQRDYIGYLEVSTVTKKRRAHDFLQSIRTAICLEIKLKGNTPSNSCSIGWHNLRLRRKPRPDNAHVFRGNRPFRYAAVKTKTLVVVF